MKQKNDKIFIGLGSNLNNPLQQLKNALIALANLPKTRVLKHSAFYSNPPLDLSHQPDYINAVAWLSTELSPLNLLNHLQFIEKQQGRIRSAQRWAARTLDLDLLLYGNLHYRDAALTLPHYGLYERAFVLKPLFDCAPDLILPNGQKLRNVVKNCDCHLLNKIDESYKK